MHEIESKSGNILSKGTMVDEKKLNLKKFKKFHEILSVEDVLQFCYNTEE